MFYLKGAARRVGGPFFCILNPGPVRELFFPKIGTGAFSPFAWGIPPPGTTSSKIAPFPAFAAGAACCGARFSLGALLQLGQGQSGSGFRRDLVLFGRKDGQKWRFARRK